MKKFTFRLQRVLDAKESEEKEKQRELGVAQRELTEAERLLADLQAQLKEEQQRANEQNQGTVQAWQALTQHRWQKHLAGEIRKAEQDVVKALDQVEKARDILIETSREKRVLEKLREKQHEEHQKLVLSELQNQLDDIGGRMAGGNTPDPLLGPENGSGNGERGER